MRIFLRLAITSKVMYLTRVQSSSLTAMQALRYLSQRNTFIEALTNDEGIITGYVDVFPKQLKNVQEDLAIQRFRKLGAEGENSYTLADESVTFDDPLPVSVEKKLYPYRQLFPRSYTLDDPVGGYKEG